LIIYLLDDPEHIFLHNYLKKGEFPWMNKEQLAQSKYHGKEKFNCTQAVLVAFQEETGMTDADIASYSNTGGGKAEGGICGAAYAAKQVLKDSGIHPHIDELFNTKAGSSCCRQIRERGQLSCEECVALAARFIVDHLPSD
jgi:hypothetical protein